MNECKVRDWVEGISIPCEGGLLDCEYDTVYACRQPEDIQDNEFNTLVEVRNNTWVAVNSIDLDFIGSSA